MKLSKYIFSLDVIYVLIVLIIFGLCVWYTRSIKKANVLVNPFYGMRNGALKPLTKTFVNRVKRDILSQNNPPSLQRTSSSSSGGGGRKFNKHEEECRRIFEKIFGKKFKSIRPAWLKNPTTGHNLEIDGFCESVKTPIGKGLGFEMDGQQHAKYTPFFHRDGVDQFKYQVSKDQFKDLKCKQKGVMLIRIPHYVAFEDLERYITTQCKKHKVL